MFKSWARNGRYTRFSFSQIISITGQLWNRKRHRFFFIRILIYCYKLAISLAYCLCVCAMMLAILARSLSHRQCLLTDKKNGMTVCFHIFSIQHAVQRGSLTPEDLKLRVTVHYGIPSTASILAFDSIQRLLALATLWVGCR